MAVQLTRNCLDVGLVTCNPDRALEFYRDVLGLPEDGEIPFPGLGLIKRFIVGDSVLRILIAETEPPYKGSTEGFATQTGLRYITLTISNLDETVAAIKKAGFKVPVEIRDLRPGVRVAQVEDDDGNAVELMQVENNG